jgi:dihydroxyacid dehydratase/phosphogluconate dehydratase
MEDFFYAGGLQAMLAELGDLIDRSQKTVNGRTLGENLEGAKIFNDDVIRRRARRCCRTTASPCCAAISRRTAP